jgi:thioredoxin reductase (NADPH)
MSENQKKQKVAIIGSGPAGLTAAIYTSRAELDTTIYTGMQPGGQLTTTTEIENFPGFPEGIMGPELMDNMQKQAERFGAKVVLAEVQGIEVHDERTPLDEPKTPIEKGEGCFVVKTTAGQEEFDAVIVASGASARYLGLPGEEKYVGRGYHSCATCDGFFYRGKTIAVIGGGDSAMEEANFLTKFAEKVYIIHRREEFRASKIMLERAKNNPKIEFVLNEVITDFIGEDKVEGVKLENTQTGEKRDFALDGVFVAIGHIPNSSFVQGLLGMDEAGYLKPESRTMSEVEGIFIAGDIEDKVYRQAITAAGDGCRAAMDCEKWLESR